jgi:hypothetical protein
MAKLDFKKWPTRVVLAVLMTMILFGAVISVAPIYGVNITPQSASGSSDVGGYFGRLVPINQDVYR